MDFGERAFGADIRVFAGNKWQMVGVHDSGNNRGGRMTKSSVPTA